MHQEHRTSFNLTTMLLGRNWLEAPKKPSDPHVLHFGQMMGETSPLCTVLFLP